MTITINLVTKNNDQTIKSTLESIKELKAKILIGDLGSKDNTIKICRQYDNAEIIPISLNNSMSVAKNLLIKKCKTEWMFFIDPWEVIISGLEDINSLSNSKDKNAYNVNFLQNDLITKETRLWHKDKNLQFKNPVFETVPNVGLETEIYLVSNNNIKNPLKIELLDQWRSNKPLSNEPLYYLSCVHLSNKEWDKFLNLADLYLYKEVSVTMSFIMTQYYCAMVKCYVKEQQDYNKAIGYILNCIEHKPLMAEFWCLLGDVFYAVSEYEKSICFYENAIILGSKRLKSDAWPMEISKYKEYPNKMIKICKNLKSTVCNYINDTKE